MYCSIPFLQFLVGAIKHFKGSVLHALIPNFSNNFKVFYFFILFIMAQTDFSFKVMNQDFVKLDRFDGINYTCWKDKMLFFLTALKVGYVLDPNLPQIPVTTPDETEDVKKERTKRQEDEFLCRGHILDTLSDHLYDLFTSVQSLREI